MPPLIKPREIIGDWRITDPEQLTGLSPLPPLHVKGQGRIRLGGTMAKHPQREQWEKDLNSHYYACGCGEGSIGMIVGLILSGIWAAIPAVFGLAPHENLIITIVAVAAIASLIGKVFGLLTNHWKLKRLVGQIQTECTD